MRGYVFCLALFIFIQGVCSFSFHSSVTRRNSIKMGIYSEMWTPLKSFRRPSAIKEVDPGAVVGTNLRILKYPHPKLRQDNKKITKITEEVKSIAKEMLLVMHAMNGVGLAAPQVGVNLRLMVMDKEHMGTTEDEIAINPVITRKSDQLFCSEEGCLSFPDLWGDVDRHTWIEVEYENIKGEKVTKRLEEFAAILFQHEYDHLDKVLFIDRMVPLTKRSYRVTEALQKMIDNFGPGGAT